MSDDLNCQVAEALARKVAYAQSLPWFRKLCPQILQVKTPQDLHRLPIQAVEDEQGGVLFSDLAKASHCAPGGGLTLTSGGSTGHRKHITHSWAFNRHIVELGLRMFGSAQSRPGVVINCLTAGEMQGAFQYAANLVEQMGARLLPAGALMGVERIAGLIQSQAADALICTPSFATALFGHDGIDVARLRSLRWLYYIGEPFSDNQREWLNRDWPALEIRSLGYSSTETGPIGFQCAHLDHGFYHLHADAMVIEVVDPYTLQAVDEGETGEFLLTPLLPDHVPLMRYRIGDIGRVLGTSSNCACGSDLPLLELQGRVETRIKLGGAIITQREVLSILGQVLPGLGAAEVQVQIQRQHDGAGICLVIAEDKVPADAAITLERELHGEHQTTALLRLPGVSGLQVRRLARRDFEITRAGKTPFFVELDSNLVTR